mmetsp:Transcript_59635/g.141908  ORF Transcript_59635/g.141908 Transcript_59635/m.141908 type:complete len:173 (+) Transcript_59635:40-558(+)
MQSQSVSLLVALGAMAVMEEVFLVKVAAESRICRSAFAFGERCSRDAQCSRQGWCSEAGRCQKPLEVSSPCLRDEQCHQGSCTGEVCRKLYFDGRQCLRDSQCFSKYCFDGICTRPPRGGPCSRDNECRGGFCDTQSGGGSCRRSVSNGRNCDRDTHCRSNAFCGSPIKEEL